MNIWFELIVEEFLLGSECEVIAGFASSYEAKWLDLLRFLDCVMLSLQLNIHFRFQRLCKVILVKQVVRRQIGTREWFRFMSSEVRISNNLVALSRLNNELTRILNIKLFSIPFCLVFILGWLLDGFVQLQLIILPHLIFMQGLRGFSNGFRQRYMRELYLFANVIIVNHFIVLMDVALLRLMDQFVKFVD